MEAGVLRAIARRWGLPWCTVKQSRVGGKKILKNINCSRVYGLHLGDAGAGKNSQKRKKRAPKTASEPLTLGGHQT